MREKMDKRKITIYAMALAGIAFIVWDVVVATNGIPGDTISEVMLDSALYKPIVAFVAGVLAGHLFWPQRK